MVRTRTEVGSMLVHLAIIIIQDVYIANNGVDVTTNGESAASGAKLLDRIQHIALVWGRAWGYVLTEDGS